MGWKKSLCTSLAAILSPTPISVPRLVWKLRRGTLGVSLFFSPCTQLTEPEDKECVAPKACRCGCTGAGCVCTGAAILGPLSVRVLLNCEIPWGKAVENSSRPPRGFFFPPLAPSIDVTSHPPLSFPLGDWGSRNMPSKNISTVVPGGTMQNRTEGVSRKWKSQPNPHRCRPFLLWGETLLTEAKSHTI